MASVDPHDAILDAGEIEASSSDDGGSGAESEAESACSYLAPLAHSVTLARAKRGNAGSGMAAQIARALADDKEKLKGQPVDDADEEFWNQDFFKDGEDEGSDNESFAESDISDEDRVDKFDSDFDDDEDDDDEQDDMELDEDEDDGKRKNVYTDPSGTKPKKRKKAIKQPIIGLKAPPKKGAATGINKGMSLGGFGALSSMVGSGMSTAEMMQLREEQMAQYRLENPDFEQQAAQTTTMTTTASSSHKKSHASQPVNSIISTRTSKQNVLRVRDAPPSPSKKEGTAIPPLASAVAKKPKPVHQFTQEFLLTEAVHETEPANFKWIAGRKRDMSAKESTLDSHATLASLASVKERRVSASRMGIGGAGMYNTITFPSVDDVPTILQKSVTIDDVLEDYADGRLGAGRVGRVDVRGIRERNGTGGGSKSKKQAEMENPVLCAITGGVAKYVDPLTKLGYCDKEGFKEIRRRWGAGNAKTSAVNAFEARDKQVGGSANDASTATAASARWGKSSSVVVKREEQ
jgi:hypothetical protein